MSKYMYLETYALGPGTPWVWHLNVILNCLTTPGQVACLRLRASTKHGQLGLQNFNLNLAPAISCLGIATSEGDRMFWRRICSCAWLYIHTCWIMYMLISAHTYSPQKNKISMMPFPKTNKTTIHPGRLTWNINHRGLVQIIFLSIHGWFECSSRSSSRV